MDLIQLKQISITQIEQTTTLTQLEIIKNELFSKKGQIANLMLELKNLPNEKKPLFGKKVNELREELLSIYQQKEAQLQAAILKETLSNEVIDVTLPAIRLNVGTIHPLNQVIMDLEDFFLGQGFSIKEGPELESDVYNFEMMNLPIGHPARDMQDSFYVDVNHLLRTHTSPVQARAMLEAKGQHPLAIICPGKVYRRDNDDLTHSHQFMQLEGLVIGQDISLANLKDVLTKLAQHLFGSDRFIRLRPSFFPFTEPSYEVDISYTKPDGTQSFLEVLGAGMVHPQVLTMGGFDPKKVNGFAFGIGIERIAMLKYNIDDIRHFYTNDIRFLKQFRSV